MQFTVWMYHVRTLLNQSLINFTEEDQLERLLFSIIFACIFFVPAIIIFIVVGCTNQRREDNDLFQRQKAHAREERRVLTKQGGGDATGTANNNVYVPQGRRSSRFTESFVTWLKLSFDFFFNKLVYEWCDSAVLIVHLIRFYFIINI